MPAILERELHFRINTYLKDLIGRELLTNKYVAVFELVKNSADARATNVLIKFIPKRDRYEAKYVAIIDDGSGMSYDDVESKWMNVAKSYKRTEMDRFASQGTIPANLYAGRKGIGRFSCDKLGETLDLYTRITKSEPWNHLVVDWNKFQSAPDKDFQEIPVAISQQAETVEAAGNLERGTVLLIGKLREEWDYESVLRLKRYLQKLLDPLSPARENAFNIIIDAPLNNLFQFVELHAFVKQCRHQFA